MLKLILLAIIGLNHADCQSTYNHVYTSGYSNKIKTFSFFDATLDQAHEVELEENLTFAVYDEEFETLYASHEVSSYGEFENSGAISRWKIGSDETGFPTFLKLQVVSSLGSGPAYFSLDKTNGLLFSANYVGSSFAVYQMNLTNGEILSPIYNEIYGEGSNIIPSRQAESHPHGVYQFQNFIYIPDLGADKIWHYQLKDGQVEKAEPSFTTTVPGSGPRHMIMDEKRQLAYVLHELKSLVHIYEIDPTSGVLSLAAKVDLLAGSPIPSEVWDYPYQYASELESHPNGKWMYFSNQIGAGAIIVFEILEDGMLQFVQFAYTSGGQPRHFKIHPDGQHLLVGNQDGNSVEVFSIDQLSGRLSQIQEIESNNTPTVVVFLP